MWLAMLLSGVAKAQLDIKTERRHNIAVRVSQDEYARLERAAKAAGQATVTAFVRTAALEKAAQLGYRDGSSD
jgi:uncharacterized protein (DUF1778 family)